jgi:hypothetical protein
VIVGITLLVLTVVSVHVRRLVNEAAMFVVCTIVWACIFVAMPLESPRRAWRLVGLAVLVAAVITFGAVADLLFRALRHLP